MSGIKKKHSLSLKIILLDIFLALFLLWKIEENDNNDSNVQNL